MRCVLATFPAPSDSIRCHQSRSGTLTSPSVRNSGSTSASSVYAKERMRIDYNARTLTASERLHQLTAAECELPCELSNYAGRILTRDGLLRPVFGPEFCGRQQQLTSFVKSHHQEPADRARSPSYIFIQHGMGYRMAKQQPSRMAQMPAFRLLMPLYPYPERTQSSGWVGFLACRASHGAGWKCPDSGIILPRRRGCRIS